MKDRRFYGDGIRFSNNEEQRDFESTVFLEESAWRAIPGKIIGRGAFRVVREAVLENLQTGEVHQMVQKKVHHPMGKHLPLMEAFKWWKLRETGVHVFPSYRLHPENFEVYVDDLRQGYGAHPGTSMVFDTNASVLQKRHLAEWVKKRPIKNSEEFLHHLHGTVAALTANRVDIFTDEVFLLVLQERDAVLQLLLGDLKMMALNDKPTGNQRSLKELLKFLSDLKVVA